MQDPKPVYLTREALQKLKEELHELKTKERTRIAKAIAEARGHGDLSENAEYDAAKEAQGRLEARIAQIEQTIAKARIIDESKIDTSKVYIFSKVRVKNMQTGVEQVFMLVSSQEVDLDTGKISVNSPIGKSLLGRSVGDVVEVKVPAGKIKLQILEISR